MSSYEPYSPQVPAQPTGRSLLVRSRHNRMLTGVCGGFADYTGIDANIIRIALVAATIFGFGSPAIVYLAAWILLPEGQ
ncbi:PspC domain-containing protein [Nocardioides immobilis]|uniref:PspC domain-containing protein n=1 Tax=Nocardioides immobilis TaxID=2049295 RepID=A0A417XZM2_9ACTN|nr:PspC domain-containing protein [Nocardioides immobilis]RHW25794.1 PspC domain-containing protein [Nocardioides immobilis]